MIMVSLITAGPHWSCDSSRTVPRSEKCSWWVSTARGSTHISFYRLSSLYSRGKPFFFSLLLSPSLFSFFVIWCKTPKYLFFSWSHVWSCEYVWGLVSVVSVELLLPMAGVWSHVSRAFFCTFRGLKLSWCQWSPTFLKMLSRLDDCGGSMRTHLTPVIDLIKCRFVQSSWDSFGKTPEKPLFWLCLLSKKGTVVVHTTHFRGTFLVLTWWGGTLEDAFSVKR